MRSTSASTAASPATTWASPPALSTSAAVWLAAASSMSQTTIRAPSSAKRTDASRPMPMPAPVISATLPESLDPMRAAPLPLRSDPLEMPDQLPVGHRLIERLLLEPSVVEVVLHDLGPERLARDLG